MLLTSLNKFYVRFFLVSTFSTVSCAPQTPSQASDDTSNDLGSSTSAEDGVSFKTPINMALLPGLSSHENGDVAVLHGNGLGMTPSKDSTVISAGLTDGGAGGALYKS